MTTPEAFRRRQLTEGVALIVIGLIMVLQGWYFQLQNTNQNECVASRFEELSASLAARDRLAQREADAARRINLSELSVSTDEEYLAALRRYDRETKEISRIRKENPLPPFPVGVCR